MNFESHILSQHGQEVFKVIREKWKFYNSYNLATIGQTQSADSDHVISLKAPEQRLNGSCGEIVEVKNEL